MTIPDIIANIRNLKSSAEMRQYWQYENIHYIVLSHLVTVLTGMPYPEWVQEHIFDPLGMTSSTYNTSEAWTSGRSTDGYVRSGRDVLKCAAGWKGVHDKISRSCLGTAKSIGPWVEGDFYTMAGAGGVVTTPRDLVGYVPAFFPFPPVLMPVYSHCGFVNYLTQRFFPPPLCKEPHLHLLFHPAKSPFPKYLTRHMVSVK
jgi:hypothetical protein